MTKAIFESALERFIEQLLLHRQVEYLVQWKSSWEAEEDIDPSFVRKYRARPDITQNTPIAPTDVTIDEKLLLGNDDDSVAGCSSSSSTITATTTISTGNVSLSPNNNSSSAKKPRIKMEPKTGRTPKNDRRNREATATQEAELYSDYEEYEVKSVRYLPSYCRWTSVINVSLRIFISILFQLSTALEKPAPDDDDSDSECYTIDKIVTISGSRADMSFIAKLTTGEYGLIAGNVAKKEFPQKVIEFYESKIQFFDRPQVKWVSDDVLLFAYHHHLLPHTYTYTMQTNICNNHKKCSPNWIR